jgi:uncharacterized repeat protein (TIGR03847 family)
MSRYELDLDPVSHITADAIGQPGQRVFYLQGWKEGRPQAVTVIIEKIQLQSLAIGIQQLLVEVARRQPELPPAETDYAEEKMHISPPVDPLFRAGDIGLGYDPARDLVVLQAREVVMEGDDPQAASLVRFWCTRSQVSVLSHWGLEVLQRGRPTCPQCGQPMEADGHFCPKKNGHKKK